jgi:hypothetical protein
MQYSRRSARVLNAWRSRFTGWLTAGRVGLKTCDEVGGAGTHGLPCALAPSVTCDGISPTAVAGMLAAGLH